VSGSAARISSSLRRWSTRARSRGGQAARAGGSTNTSASSARSDSGQGQDHDSGSGHRAWTSTCRPPHSCANHTDARTSSAAAPPLKQAHFNRCGATADPGSRCVNRPAFSRAARNCERRALHDRHACSSCQDSAGRRPCPAEGTTGDRAGAEARQGAAQLRVAGLGVWQTRVHHPRAPRGRLEPTAGRARTSGRAARHRPRRLAAATARASNTAEGPSVSRVRFRVVRRAKRPELAANTARSYRNDLTKHLLPFFAEHTLSQITISESTATAKRRSTKPRA
jgi:hypothetical protein